MIVTCSSGAERSCGGLVGASLHLSGSENVWRVPLGFQFVPAGFMFFGLFTVKVCLGTSRILFVGTNRICKESPRWLAYAGRHEEALRNLAYLRRQTIHSVAVRVELAEIEAAIEEEHEGISIRDAFLARGNRIRFFIAFIIFFLQQSCGQNSVNYYAPTIFQSIGYTGTSVSLLAAGIYGVVKVIATALFVYAAVDSLGRKRSLLISAVGMGTLFFIIGALLKVFPPDPQASTPSPASKAMAAMLYIYVCFYSLGWGPITWVYSSDIFPTRTRHYGLACASASQWLWSALNLPLSSPRVMTLILISQISLLPTTPPCG